MLSISYPHSGHKLRDDGGSFCASALPVIIGCRLGQVRRGQGEERVLKWGNWMAGSRISICGAGKWWQNGAEREKKKRNGAAWWTVMVMLLESY